MPDNCILTVQIDDEFRRITVNKGENLRQILLENDISPYGTIPDKINCGGRGLCATCGVHIRIGEPSPKHWHDRIGAKFGYPRLSCQVTIDHDMTVRILTEKWIWGRRDHNRKSTL